MQRVATLTRRSARCTKSRSTSRTGAGSRMVVVSSRGSASVIRGGGHRGGGECEHGRQRAGRDRERGDRGRPDRAGDAVADRVPALAAALGAFVRPGDPGDAAAEAAGEQRAARSGDDRADQDQRHRQVAERERRAAEGHAVPDEGAREQLAAVRVRGRGGARPDGPSACGARGSRREDPADRRRAGPRRRLERQQSPDRRPRQGPLSLARVAASRKRAIDRTRPMLCVVSVAWPAGMAYAWQWRLAPRPNASTRPASTPTCRRCTTSPVSPRWTGRKAEKLEAIYFDTADLRLARHGATLRGAPAGRRGLAPQGARRRRLARPSCDSRSSRPVDERAASRARRPDVGDGAWARRSARWPVSRPSAGTSGSCSGARESCSPR